MTLPVSPYVLMTWNSFNPALNDNGPSIWHEDPSNVTVVGPADSVEHPAPTTATATIRSFDQLPKQNP
jgi:hypothetical protein